MDERGILVRPSDRFEVEPALISGIFGTSDGKSFAGARFLMRRMTIGSSNLGNDDGPAAENEPQFEVDDQGVAVVEIPFPDDSFVRRMPFDSDAKTPFTAGYLRRLGNFGHSVLGPWECEWQPGSTLVWNKYRDHFQEMIQQLNAQGWELAEDFEEFDEDGYLVNAADRFVLEEIHDGVSHRDVFAGAEFRIRRSRTGPGE